MVPGEYITRHGFMDWRIYGEYGDVTINFPKYSLDDGECFLSSDCPNLINEMVKTDTWKLQDRLKSIMVIIRSANLHRNLLTNLKIYYVNGYFLKEKER